MVALNSHWQTSPPSQTGLSELDIGFVTRLHYLRLDINIILTPPLWAGHVVLYRLDVEVNLSSQHFNTIFIPLDLEMQ